MGSPIAHPALSPEQQQQVAAQKRIRASEGNSAVKKPRNDRAYVTAVKRSQYCEACRDHWVQQWQPGWKKADIRPGATTPRIDVSPVANVSARTVGRPGTIGRSNLPEPSGSSHPKSRSRRRVDGQASVVNKSAWLCARLRCTVPTLATQTRPMAQLGDTEPRMDPIYHHYRRSPPADLPVRSHPLVRHPPHISPSPPLMVA
jgi:hypothetical protein